MNTTLSKAAMLCLLTLAARAAIPNNGGFENGREGWKDLWTRESKAGTFTIDNGVYHSGKSSGKIEHRGEKDWSLEIADRLPAQPGDMFEMEAWVKVQGPGSVELCASLWGAQDKN